MVKKKLEEAPADAQAAAEEEAPKAEPVAAEKPRRARARKPAEKPAAKKAVKAPKPAGPLGEDEVHVYSLDGDVVKNVRLPPVFLSPLRFDLVRRAVTAFQANRRQPYGPNRKAGMRHSVRWSGKGAGASRVPRIRGTMIGAQAPGTVGGRKGHGPKPWADWSLKINAKERTKARNAALAAVRSAEAVSGRGHRFDSHRTLPIVVEDALEAIWETLEDDKEEDRVRAVARAVAILRALGLYEDVERAVAGRHVRAGRGKMRGRRIRVPRSVLLVATKADGVRRCFGNLPGVEVVTPSGLNAEVLAPGGDPGRLTVFTESALEAVRGWAA